MAGPATADRFLTFTALLNGPQGVPPALNTAQGSAFLTFNKKSKELCFSISYVSLSGPELFSHVHGPAIPTSTAPVVFTLPTANAKNGCVSLDRDTEKNLKSGRLYINVHTNMYPTGEIRGQIIRTSLNYGCNPSLQSCTNLPD